MCALNDPKVSLKQQVAMIDLHLKVMSQSKPYIYDAVGPMVHHLVIWMREVNDRLMTPEEKQAEMTPEEKQQ